MSDKHLQDQAGASRSSTHHVLRWSLRLVVTAAAVWHGIAMRDALASALMRGRDLAGRARRVESHPLHAQGRVLLLGDSTVVGVAGGAGSASLPGLLAAEFPRVEIFNACSNGAQVADLLDQWRHCAVSDRHFDLVIVLAGGNDVLKLTDLDALVLTARALLRELRPQVRHVVWMGSADIGTAPALMAPLSWVLSWLCRRAMRRLEQAVKAEGAVFIDFCGREHQRVFSGQPERYFAVDGLYPSAAGYRHCFDELKRRAPLGELLTTH